MKKIIYFGLILLLSACSHQVTKEEAKIFKDKFLEINEKTGTVNQDFIDKATSELKFLLLSYNANLDFETLKTLHQEAHQATTKGIEEASQIDEIDEEVNYKAAFINYYKIELEVLDEFKNWIALLEKTRKETLVNEANSKLMNILKQMKIKEEKFLKTQNEFNEKYKL